MFFVLDEVHRARKPLQMCCQLAALSLDAPLHNCARHQGGTNVKFSLGGKTKK